MSLSQIAARVPVIRAEGASYEIGFAHGEQGREQVNLTLDNLRQSTAKTVGYDWDACKKIASAFLPAVRSKVPYMLEEIQGIAEGSGNSFEDIFTLNCRTELGWQFAHQLGKNMDEVKLIVGGCSVIGANGTRTVTGTTIYGQNWDYMPTQEKTLVFMIAKQINKPAIAWIGEAGLICRMAGLNSAGIGMGGNSLFSNGPINFQGLPLQFAYRHIMDQKTFPEAVQAAVDASIASNNNILVCGPEGEMVNLEFEYKNYGMLYMKNGVISHANTYRHKNMPHAPYRELDYPVDELRAYRLEYLMDNLKDKISVEDMANVLSDHVNYPHSICSHAPDFPTMTSTLCDLNKLEMYVSVGNPCGERYFVKPFEE